MLGFFVCLLCGAVLARSAPLAAQSDPAAETFRLINELRASLGLPAYQYNASLAVAAQNHASWMAATVIFSHTGAGGSSPLSRAIDAGYFGRISENIVGGPKMSPRQGLIWWENSPIHYNTLVSGRYVDAGVGFATNGEHNMYVLVVGTESGAEGPVLGNRAPQNLAEPLIITPIELAEPREDGSIVHVMRKGQALWTVAAYYDVDLDYLYLINNLDSDDVLHPGTEVTVRLADGQAPPPTPTPPLTYRVQAGDSVWTVAGKNGITVDYLLLLNGIGQDAVLHPGDEIVVRLAEGQAPPPTPTPPTTHVVSAGQSAWTIAALYGLTVEELLALNDMTPESIILPGDELKIVWPTATPLPTEVPATPIRVASQSEAISQSTSFSPSPVAAEAGPTLVPLTTSIPLDGQPAQDEDRPGSALAPLAMVMLAAAAGTVFFVVRRQNH